ncbi:DUF4344 domain-containing metallopeptidase [Thalassococcus sp. S3]|uniref:DUF4344 domain-containing metallopeptidase n=1 Tax=Thalassococcus sp. S3 TaxID=2017482 RepID=UPI0010241E7C|nr:DUF4344 domain-containing metallopeptidase [Thalassococcus sp. S3]QBF30891.1 hypothetical protein CFI11_06630 [Thalassococcus sp. S3]
MRRGVIRGLAAAWFAFGAGMASAEMPSFTRNVTTHVVIHELAHALIREFDLPVLGNEEVIADAFATLFIARVLPDRAEDIVKDRARSWWIEADGQEVDLQGEHPPDARRAYRAVCLLYGYDPAAYADLPAWAGLSDDDAAACADSAPEIARSWRRMLRSYVLPEGTGTREFRILYGDGPMELEMRQSGLMEELGALIARFDWHSRITLLFDHCDGGAVWSRSRRTIRLCDDYVARFNTQAGMPHPR